MKTISLLSVEITNFKSIRSCKVDFPQSAGLRFLGGDNEVEKDLGANGAGKSSLWRAIQWCLYGEGRLSTLSSWGTENTCVVVQIDASGIVYNFKREGPPAKVYLDDVLVDQQKVDDLLGLSKLTFPHAVMFNQGYRLLPDLTIPERGELLEEVLKLSFWAKCSETAVAKLKILDGEIAEVKNETAVVEGKLLGLEREDSLWIKLDEWEKSRGVRVLNLLNQSDTWKSGMAEKVRQLLQQEAAFDLQVQQEVKELAAKEQSWKEEQDALLNKKIDRVQELEVELSFYGANLPAQISNIKNILNHHELQLGAQQKVIGQLDYRNQEAYKDISYWFAALNCSACGQEITTLHRDTQVNKIAATRLQIQEQSAIVTKEIESRTSEITKAKKDLSFLEDELRTRDRLQKEIDKLVVEVEGLATSLKKSPFTSMKLNRVNPYSVSVFEAGKTPNPYPEMILLEQNSVNPYTKSIEQNKATRVQFQTELGLKKKELETIQSKHGLVEYWKQGFKRLRIFLINRVLKALEVDVNSAASALGLNSWQLSLTSETTTKSETVKLGVQIQIKSPESLTWVPWESWSGGESQRLRLALALGLASMLQRSSGVVWNLEVYDEPTTFLSVEGVENLLATLDYRSEVMKKAIWIVDHVAVNYSNFKDSWVARKTTEGTKIDENS